MKRIILFSALILSTCLITMNSYARIKLITLPVRELVEIQLDNDKITIVEEERMVPLKNGVNTIDFAWHNTSINPDTIVLRIMPSKSTSTSNIKTNILSVSYPPNEAALTWVVAASDNGSALLRISYAIDNLKQKYHYIANSDADEQMMNIKQFMKVNNQSGEQYDPANINTGTGKVQTLPLGQAETQEFENQYFTSVPILKTYTVNATQYGYRERNQDKLNVLMHYDINNDQQHNLGKHPLKAGKYRIYQKDKQGTSVFVGEDWGKFTAINDESKLYIGQARDVVVKRTVERKKRNKINGNLYHVDVVVKYQIENFKDKSIDLTIEESMFNLRNEVFSGRNHLLEWVIGDATTFSEKPIKKLTSSNKLAYKVKVPARTGTEKSVMLVEKLNVTFKNEW